MTQVYNQDGVTATLDGETVHVSVEDVHQLSLTTGEFMRIAIALVDGGVVGILPTQDREYEV